ncbi:hypothetical protein PSN01_04922 [Micromonospora saelicesensis]|nr:hypothetical protein PSN01_04922 [Micromonospora saelicesensis]
MAKVIEIATAPGWPALSLLTAKKEAEELEV